MKKLFVELANNPLKREQGLMGRKKLAKNHGMLFDFRHATRLSFWMQNTYIPLDIAFIDEDGFVTEIQTMTPLCTKAITSRNRCRYALEVNKGWFDNNNVVEGAKVLGFGIHGQDKHTLTAQMTPQPPAGQDNLLDLIEDVPEEGEEGELPPEEEQAEARQPDPDVMLNKSFKDMLEDADRDGKDMNLIYQKEDGYVLPPKKISPPFSFEKDEDGHINSIVKAWDNQDASWKSFLIDNIIDLEPVEENLIPEQDLAQV